MSNTAHRNHRTALLMTAAFALTACKKADEHPTAAPTVTVPAPPASTQAASATVAASAAPPVASVLRVRWQVRRKKPSSNTFEVALVVGTEVHPVGTMDAVDDSSLPADLKMSTPSKTRTELASAVEGAPWFSATLKDGALTIERHDPGKSAAKEIKRIPTAATEVRFKAFVMPKPKPAPCATGTFRGGDGACLKECTADTDCASGEVCEEVHDFSEGRIGALLGRGCSP